MMYPFTRAALSTGGAIALAVVLSGCVPPEQQRQANANEDQSTCSRMGAAYGSPAFTKCMLQQQERRDNKQLIFLEEARINSELARNAQKMRNSPNF